MLQNVIASLDQSVPEHIAYNLLTYWSLDVESDMLDWKASHIKPVIYFGIAHLLSQQGSMEYERWNMG